MTVFLNPVHSSCPDIKLTPITITAPPYEPQIPDPPLENPLDQALNVLLKEGCINENGQCTAAILQKKFPSLTGDQIQTILDLLLTPLEVCSKDGAKKIQTDIFTLLKKIDDYCTKIHYPINKLYLIGSKVPYVLGKTAIAEDLNGDSDHLSFNVGKDTDIRIFFKKTHSQQFEFIFNVIDEFIAEQSSSSQEYVMDKDKGFYLKRKPVVSSLNNFSIISLGVENGHHAEIMPVRKLLRHNLFNLDDLKLDILSLIQGKTTPIIPEYFYNGHQAMVDLSGKLISAQNPETIDHNGWIRFICYLTKGFRCWDKDLYHILLNTFLTAGEQTGTTFLQCILHCLKEHLPQDNDIAALFLLTTLTYLKQHIDPAIFEELYQQIRTALLGFKELKNPFLQCMHKYIQKEKNYEALSIQMELAGLLGLIHEENEIYRTRSYGIDKHSEYVIQAAIGTENGKSYLHIPYNPDKTLEKAYSLVSIEPWFFDCLVSSKNLKKELSYYHATIPHALIKKLAEKVEAQGNKSSEQIAFTLWSFCYTAEPTPFIKEKIFKLYFKLLPAHFDSSAGVMKRLFPEVNLAKIEKLHKKNDISKQVFENAFIETLLKDNQNANLAFELWKEISGKRTAKENRELAVRLIKPFASLSFLQAYEIYDRLVCSFKPNRHEALNAFNDLVANIKESSSYIDRIFNALNAIASEHCVSGKSAASVLAHLPVFFPIFLEKIAFPKVKSLLQMLLKNEYFGENCALFNSLFNSCCQKKLSSNVDSILFFEEIRKIAEELKIELSKEVLTTIYQKYGNTIKKETYPLINIVNKLLSFKLDEKESKQYTDKLAELISYATGNMSYDDLNTFLQKEMCAKLPNKKIVSLKLAKAKNALHNKDFQLGMNIIGNCIDIDSSVKEISSIFNKLIQLKMKENMPFADFQVLYHIFMDTKSINKLALDIELYTRYLLILLGTDYNKTPEGIKLFVHTFKHLFALNEDEETCSLRKVLSIDLLKRINQYNTGSKNSVFKLYIDLLHKNLAKIIPLFSQADEYLIVYSFYAHLHLNGPLKISSESIEYGIRTAEILGMNKTGLAEDLKNSYNFLFRLWAMSEQVADREKIIASFIKVSTFSRNLRYSKENLNLSANFLIEKKELLFIHNGLVDELIKICLAQLTKSEYVDPLSGYFCQDLCNNLANIFEVLIVLIQNEGFPILSFARLMENPLLGYILSPEKLCEYSSTTIVTLLSIGRHNKNRDCTLKGVELFEKKYARLQESPIFCIAALLTVTEMLINKLKEDNDFKSFKAKIDFILSGLGKIDVSISKKRGFEVLRSGIFIHLEKHIYDNWPLTDQLKARLKRHVENFTKLEQLEFSYRFILACSILSSGINHSDAKSELAVYLGDFILQYLHFPEYERDLLSLTRCLCTTNFFEKEVEEGFICKLPEKFQKKLSLTALLNDGVHEDPQKFLNLIYQFAESVPYFTENNNSSDIKFLLNLYEDTLHVFSKRHFNKKEHFELLYNSLLGTDHVLNSCKENEVMDNFIKVMNVLAELASSFDQNFPSEGVLEFFCSGLKRIVDRGTYQGKYLEYLCLVKIRLLPRIYSRWRERKDPIWKTCIDELLTIQQASDLQERDKKFLGIIQEDVKKNIL